MMIRKFKSLLNKQKLVISIIAILIFPITLTLLSAELAINGFRQGKAVKLLVGIFLLLLMIGVLWQSEAKVSSSLYNEQKIELDKANQDLNEAKANLKAQEQIIKKAKVYLNLKDEDKSKVNKFIDDINSKENVSKQEKNKQGSVEISDTEGIKNNTNVKSVENNNNEKYITNVEQQEPEVVMENTVYANAGSSKSNKYHSSSTAHNMEGSIGMSEDEAQLQGYEPCGKCY